jgi:hypothetical protein
MGNLISLSDCFIIPFYLLIAWLVAHGIEKKNIEQYPFYRYFTLGLFAKIFAGIAFALIYTFYYGETDTHYYYWGSQSLVRLAGKDFSSFLQIMFGSQTPELFSKFDTSTGYPTYWRDVNSFAVCRFNVPFYLMGFGSFLANTVVMNIFLYSGVWRFYKLTLKLFPNCTQLLAVALLFVPSVLFWGSGLLKDGWCLTATFFIFISVYSIFIEKKKVFFNIVALLFWCYTSISIRPYSFYTTLGSSLIWIGFHYILNVKNRFARTMIFPIGIAAIWIVGTSLFTKLSMFSGDRYSSMDSMIETAWVIQDDLKRDYYGGNSFDIGYFEPTLPGILGKAPKAIVAGIFRPFLWESRSVFMAISGLETFILLIFFIYIIMRVKIWLFFKTIFSNPFLLSGFIFMVTYSFFVGLTTANYGALVRYRMPVFVFLSIILVIAYNNFQERKEELIL